MSDIVGRIGPAHPDWPGRSIDRMAEGEPTLRNRIREAIEELEAAGHDGCAEIIRARVWHG